MLEPGPAWTGLAEPLKLLCCQRVLIRQRLCNAFELLGLPEPLRYLPLSLTIMNIIANPPTL